MIVGRTSRSVYRATTSLKNISPYWKSILPSREVKEHFQKHLPDFQGKQTSRDLVALEKHIWILLLPYFISETLWFGWWWFHFWRNSRDPPHWLLDHPLLQDGRTLLMPSLPVPSRPFPPLSLWCWVLPVVPVCKLLTVFCIFLQSFSLSVRFRQPISVRMWVFIKSRYLFIYWSIFMQFIYTHVCWSTVLGIMFH